MVRKHPQHNRKWEIESILNLGVEVRTGVRFGQDLHLENLAADSDVSFAASSGLKTTGWNTIESDPGTLQTNIPYLFVTEDVASGFEFQKTAEGHADAA